MLAGRRLAQPKDEKLLNDGALLLTTMHAFKGLEKQVVIAIDLRRDWPRSLGDASLCRLVKSSYVASCSFAGKRDECLC